MELADLYRDIVETSPDGIWVIGLDGGTVYANPEIARIHGIPESELASLTVFDTLDEAGRLQFADHLELVRAGRTNQSDVEVHWVRRDGTVAWMLCSESALRDADGTTTALLHRYSDYTERKALIQSLRASENALEDQIAQNTLMQAVASAANEARSLVDVLVQARDLVLLHDDWERARAFVPEGPEAERVVPFYATAEDREADRDDPLAGPELALAQRSFTTRRLVWDDAKLAIAIPVVVEEQVYAVVVITSAPPLFRFEMIEAMATRVAEQLARVVERELHQAALAAARDAAMEASQQKSEFLATMSHEIRTPLNGVIGLNDLLMRTSLTAEQHRLVSGVQVASRTLLGLINDILDFSKIEAGHLELEQLDFEVRPLLEDAAGLLIEAARDKGLDLIVSCHRDVPAVLSGDPTKLARVVTNLVSNAVKFTDRGRVVVRTTSEPAGGRVRFRVEVTDTGVGVAPEKLQGLFDPFTQADSSTTRVHGGTGLGLAISRDIVEAMGGLLEHAPNPAGGSVFSCSVLLDESRGSEAPIQFGAMTPAAPHLGLAGRRAVVVDDAGVERWPRDEPLVWWGVQVQRLDRVEALGPQLREGPSPDVVVLDLTHPDRDAATAAAVVREHAATDPAYNGVGVLLVTPAGFEPPPPPPGVDEVLARPFGARALLHALNRILPAPPSLETTAPIEPADPAVAAAPVVPVVPAVPAVPVVADTPAPGTARSKGWILVVEDNPINQMVATGLLDAMGYTTDTAEDGLAAIEAARTGGFDAILMDVQMPHMDGYTATERIRAAERGRRRPIIAMTATAVEGERERCLAAGMDDFLTKPVDAHRLGETLDRWLRPHADEPPAPVTVPVPAPSPAPAYEERLTTQRLVELREVDVPQMPSYVARAIDNFIASIPRDLAAMADALAAGDAPGLRSVAHRFVGAALNLGATRAGEASRELERMAVTDELDGAAAVLERLAAEAEADGAALRSYLAATFPATTG